MTPDNSILAGKLPGEATARALVEPGRQYAVYIRGDGVKQLAIDLPAGNYLVQWVDTREGSIGAAKTIAHTGGRCDLPVPDYSEDIALRIVRR